MISQKQTGFLLLNGSVCIRGTNRPLILSDSDDFDLAMKLQLGQDYANIVAKYLLEHKGTKEITLEVQPLKFIGMSGNELTDEQVRTFRGKILAGNVEIKNWEGLNGKRRQDAVGIDIEHVTSRINGMNRMCITQLTQEEWAEVARNGLTCIAIDPNAAQEGAGA